MLELSLENISVAISGKEILNSIDLKVEDGAFISLLGASGCGKSTLLKTIAGIIPQASGSVYLDGKCADRLTPHKRGTVIVFQDFRLFPHMTVAENIGFPLKMRGITRAEYLKTASELLKKVQLEGFEKRRPEEMSGGQIQRVALARALASKPNVLLLDEPFSSLDENLRQDMRDLVLKLHREFKITTVLVTHNYQEALSMSDKIALMLEGRVIQYDTPERMFEAPANREVADFFGNAVYVDGTVTDNLFQSSIVTFRTEKMDGCYQAMFRNSAVHIQPEGDKAFRIIEKNYRGEDYGILLEHRTGCRFNIIKAAPCEYKKGDNVAVFLDTEGAVLFSA